VSVSLCVSVFAIISFEQNVSKNYERILMKFFGWVDRGPRTSPLDFGGNPVSFVNPGFFTVSRWA